MSAPGAGLDWLRKRLAGLRAVKTEHDGAQPMPRVAVVTDSAAALPAELIAAFGRGALSVVPMPVMVNGEIYSEGDDELIEVLSLALAAGKAVKTSRPSPGQFERVYQSLADQGFESILSIHISADLSGTVEAARLAARRVAIPVRVLDSRTVAMAQGFAVRGALLAAALGDGLDSVAKAAEDSLASSSMYFYVPSLEQLRRGGRIGAAASWLGTMLSIKPILSVRNGQVVPVERVRSAAKAISRVAELAEENLAARSKPSSVAIHDFGNPAQGQSMLQRLSVVDVAPAEIFISDLPAVLAAHVGLGVLAVVINEAPLLDLPATRPPQAAG